MRAKGELVEAAPLRPARRLYRAALEAIAELSPTRPMRSVHLEAVNRPANDPEEFEAVNVGFTRDVVERLRPLGRSAPVVYASSTQAGAEQIPTAGASALRRRLLDGYAAADRRAVRDRSEACPTSLASGAAPTTIPSWPPSAIDVARGPSTVMVHDPSSL